jgi:hypothetical protein
LNPCERTYLENQRPAMTRRSFGDRLRNPQRTVEVGGAATLADDLERLRTSETGAGYVYFALDLLASRYALTDAYIVIDLGPLGLQVFRLGGKTKFPGRDEVQHAQRGVFSEPIVVPESDARIFYDACALELMNPRPLQPGIDKLYSPDSLQAKTSSRTPAANGDVSDDEWFISGSTGDSWRVGQLDNAPLIRRRFTQFLVCVDIANLIMAFANTHGPEKFFLGLLFGVFVPGWSIIGYLRLKNAALEIGLSVATSLALIMVSAQIMITLNLWHLVAFEELLAIVCLLPLLPQSTVVWMKRLEE